ncbi:MAG: response regulator [Bacteroidetes bacterium]|nr:response regulator [Bacteroidota bacterium]
MLHSAELNFRHIGIADGLPNSTVTVIHQDRFGFMWFGTREGLVRYDGISMREPWFSLPEKSGMIDRMITGIAEDSSGNLFVSVWGTGIYYYNRYQGRMEVACGADTGAVHWCRSVWALTQNEEGTLFAATQGHGLFVRNPGDNAWKHSAALWPKYNPGNMIRALAIDSSGKIWTASEERGIVCFDPKTNQQQSMILANTQGALPQVNAIAFYQGRVLAGTSEGLFLQEEADSQKMGKYFCRGFSDPLIRSIVIAEGKWWIGTDGQGLLVVHPEEGTCAQETFTGRPGGLTSSVIFRLFRSREGHLWIGTNKGGVNVLFAEARRLKPHKLALPDTVSRQMVMAIHHDRSGQLWIGTDGGGVFRASSSSGNKIADQIFNAGRVVKTIFEDGRGNLYFGTYGQGMAVRDSGGRWLVFREKPGTNNESFNNVWAFAEDAEGNVWVGTLNGGMRLFDPSKMDFIAFEVVENELVPQSILVLIYHPFRGSLLAGSFGGLFELKYAGGRLKVSRVATDPTHPLSTAEVKALHLDREGNVWAGTRSRGLFKLDSGLRVVQQFGRSNGLSSNSIAAIRQESNDFIWVSGGSGMNRIDPRDGTVLTYTLEDDLRVQEYLSESAATLPGGMLAFGGVYGLDSFDPGMVRKDQYAAPVYFSRLFVMNEEVKPTSTEGLLKSDIAFQTGIRLAYHQNTFSLEFQALNYVQPESGKYAYLLEGFDKDWNNIGSQRRVTFTNLDPGTYTLRVRAANADGVWSPHEAILKVVVVPPWWDTWQARLLFVMLVIGITGLVITRRFRAEVSRRRELEVLVGQRTMELENEKLRVEAQNRELSATRDELLARNAEILAQKDEIERISAQLHEADQLKLNFFTTISHEIRTPLTLMMSPLHEILKRAETGDTWMSARLQTLHRNLLNLLDLVDQLLEFQRLERQDESLQAFPHNLAQVLGRLCSDVAPRADAAGIMLTLSCDEALPDVWIDLPKFQKIIYNLLSNAIKFTPSGGNVSVEILENACNELDNNNLTDCVVIRVSDSGIGFPPGDAERIFESFFQSQNSRLKGFGGTGIGLSTARKMAVLHHGWLRASSPETGGAVFELILPVGDKHLRSEEKLISAPSQSSVLKEEIAVKQGITKESSRRTGRSGRRPTVLLVEDNQELREYLSDYLADTYNVFNAPNGLKGWVRLQEIVPDLVVSDIIMPEMDGIALLRKIKDHPRYAHIPVILLTAKTLIADKLLGLGYGADDYIGKPFMLDELKLRIDNTLKAISLLREKMLAVPWEIPEETTLPAEDAQFLLRLNDILAQHYHDEHFGVTGLVSAMGMSRTSLHTRLKRVAGVSASDWIKNYRLSKAADMLRNQALTVSEVAWKCGLPNTAYFIRLFREQYGITPGMFQEKHAQNRLSEQ